MKTATSRPRLSTFLLLSCMSFFGIQAHAQAIDRIATVDNSARVLLPLTAPSLVQAGTDMGRVNADFRMERMLLVLGPSDARQSPGETFLDSQQDKKSP